MNYWACMVRIMYSRASQYHDYRESYDSYRGLSDSTVNSQSHHRLTTPKMEDNDFHDCIDSTAPTSDVRHVKLTSSQKSCTCSGSRVTLTVHLWSYTRPVSRKIITWQVRELSELKLFNICREFRFITLK